MTLMLHLKNSFVIIRTTLTADVLVKRCHQKKGVHAQHVLIYSLLRRNIRWFSQKSEERLLFIFLIGMPLFGLPHFGS